MKFVRNTLQSFANHKEKEPRENKTKAELNHTPDPAQSGAPRLILFRQLRKAGSAEDTIIVFGDAFTAEIAGTTRTSCDGFPPDMIETALVSETAHV